METIYLLLANAILIFHGLIVLFNLAALPVIWVGYFRRWSWVRNFAFRCTHLLLIGFVALEAALGAICPLTTWEEYWRTKAGADRVYEGDFVAHWLHRLLFYDLEPHYFAIGYGAFLGLVILSWVVVRPQAPRWWARWRNRQVS